MPKRVIRIKKGYLKERKEARKAKLIQSEQFLRSLEVESKDTFYINQNVPLEQ